ncbi:MAG: hypothetical protein ACR2KW_04835 [Rubrobacter sp.]
MGIGKKVEGAAKKAMSDKTSGKKGKTDGKGKKSGGGVEGKIKKALK